MILGDPTSSHNLRATHSVYVFKNTEAIAPVAFQTVLWGWHHAVKGLPSDPEDHTTQALLSPAVCPQASELKSLCLHFLIGKWAHPPARNRCVH